MNGRRGDIDRYTALIFITCTFHFCSGTNIRVAYMAVAAPHWGGRYAVGKVAPPLVAQIRDTPPWAVAHVGEISCVYNFNGVLAPLIKVAFHQMWPAVRRRRNTSHRCSQFQYISCSGCAKTNTDEHIKRDRRSV